MASCWTCRFQANEKMELLGSCLYFERLGRPPRIIPPDVVDVGCKFHEQKPQQESNG